MTFSRPQTLTAPPLTETAPSTLDQFAAAREVMHLMRGFVVAKSVYVAAQLRLADAVAESPRTATELATAASTHPPSLHRLLRALCSIEVFTEVRPGTFELGRLGPALLTAGDDVSVRNWVLMSGGPLFRAFDALPGSIATGSAGFADVLGLPFFDYLERSPEEEAIFQSAMAEVAAHTAVAVSETCELSRCASVLDVGGGTGTLLASLLQANTHLTGTLFDRSHVLAAATRTLTDAGVHDRCRLVGGDFFVEVPPGADTYFLSWILHDWDDEPAGAILRSCRRAMSATSRLVVVEAVLPPPSQPHFAHFGDLVMLVALGGRERTEEEYQALLEGAGFRLERVTNADGVRSVLEAVPV